MKSRSVLVAAIVSIAIFGSVTSTAGRLSAQQPQGTAESKDQKIEQLTKLLQQRDQSIADYKAALDEEGIKSDSTARSAREFRDKMNACEQGAFPLFVKKVEDNNDGQTIDPKTFKVVAKPKAE